MRNIKPAAKAPVICLLTALGIYAQAANQAPAPGPDVLVCKDGEKFVGHLVSSKDTSVVFKSDVAGEVTIDWAKIQELHSAAKFAAIPKDVKLKNEQDSSKVPQGTVSMTDQKLEISPAAQETPQTVPVTNVAELVGEAAFQKAFQRRSFFQGWNGGVTAGVAYANSTQRSQSYTAAANLTRAVPGEDWLNLRSRTIVLFNEAYGSITQPNTPTVKTSITHFGVEQDWYVKPRLYVFVHALLDHDYSQGLDLQQTYGGGLGFVVFKSDRQEFDVKASVDYINQRFAISSENKSLIGSTFGETYVYNFPYKIVFSESGGFIPAWNDTNAYSAFANAGFTFPVYHRFGFTLAGTETYLNDPPVGFKKNSFTITLGATYSFQ